MKLGARDAGIFLAGMGLFVLGIIVLHVYVTKILPYSEQTSLGVDCKIVNNDTAVITVKNYGTSEDIVKANVYVNDTFVCQLNNIPPASSDVCKVDIKKIQDKTPIFRVEATTSSGKKLKDAGVCTAHISSGTVD